MAAKNILKTSDYVPNDDILVGIISVDPPYKVCYLLSQVLARTFVINTHFSNKDKKHTGNFANVPEKSMYIEYFRWNSDSKGKTIYLVPNRQEIEIAATAPLYPSLYTTEEVVTTKTMLLLPNWKQINYVLRFDGFEHPEIVEIAERIKKSKKFQLVVTSQTSKIENAGALYFIE
jgi:hypothetical protein